MEILNRTSTPHWNHTIGERSLRWNLLEMRISAETCWKKHTNSLTYKCCSLELGEVQKKVNMMDLVNGYRRSFDQFWSQESASMLPRAGLRKSLGNQAVANSNWPGYGRQRPACRSLKNDLLEIFSILEGAVFPRPRPVESIAHGIFDREGQVGPY